MASNYVDNSQSSEEEQGVLADNVDDYRLAFYSEILADKRWESVPVWKTADDENVQVVMVASPHSPIGKNVERFLKYNQNKYPDFRRVADVIEVVRSGVKKEAVDEPRPHPSEHICCDRMRSNLQHTCDQHESPYDCPDKLVVYWPNSGTYGLIVHDGGQSAVEISFCPWCGTNLRNPRIL